VLSSELLVREPDHARSPKARLRRVEEKLGKAAPARPANQDPRVVGFAD
jgi:hypothetical protein